MEKIVITQFSDPMMGLSWECEPALQQVVGQFDGAVDLNDRMVVLVRDVADFMTSAERALSPEEGIRTYNARLAQIYLDEQAIGGVPINMNGFCLFAPDRRSSLPLCLAYEAAKLVDPAQARPFLMRLRAATVQECRPTTKHDEIMRVVRLCGIDQDAFVTRLENGDALAALKEDARYAQSLGVVGLPAFSVACGDRMAIIRGVATYELLMRAIDSVTFD